MNCSDCGADPRTKLNCICFGLAGKYAFMVEMRKVVGPGCCGDRAGDSFCSLPIDHAGRCCYVSGISDNK